MIAIVRHDVPMMFPKPADSRTHEDIDGYLVAESYHVDVAAGFMIEELPPVAGYVIKSPVSKAGAQRGEVFVADGPPAVEKCLFAVMFEYEPERSVDGEVKITSGQRSLLVQDIDSRAGLAQMPSKDK